MIVVSLIHALPILFVIFLLTYAVFRQRKELQDIYKELGEIRKKITNLEIVSSVSAKYENYCSQRYPRDTPAS